MGQSFCFEREVVLVYCHLGKLKAKDGPPLLSSHQNVSPKDKSFLSSQLKSRLCPLPLPTFCLQKNYRFQIHQRSYIRHGDNHRMAPTRTPPPLSNLHSPLTSANNKHGLLRTSRRRQLLHSAIPPHSQIPRTPPLRRLRCCRNIIGPSIQIVWRMHDHPVLCTSRSRPSLAICLLILI